MYIVLYTYMSRTLPLPAQLPQLFAAPLGARLDLRQLLKLFTRLGAAKDLALPPGRQRAFYQRVFCPLVTLWGMVLQRLLADPTLENVVVHFAHGQADALRPGKTRLSQKIKSTKTASFSDARQRLPLEVLKKVFTQLPARLGPKITGRDWQGVERPAPGWQHGAPATPGRHSPRLQAACQSAPGPLAGMVKSAVGVFQFSTLWPVIKST